MKEATYILTFLMINFGFTQDNSQLMETIQLSGLLNDMPNNPVDGQIYYNDATKLVYAYNASRKIWFINRGGPYVNLFNAKTINYGVFVNSKSGNLQGNNQYNTSDYIPVISNQCYIASHNMRSTCFFNEDKNFVPGGSFENSNNTQVTIPNDVTYIRISYKKEEDNIFQFQPKKSYDEQINELYNIKRDKKPSELTLFTAKAKQVLAERLMSTNGYSLGDGFEDDFTSIKANTSTFVANPDLFRPNYGADKNVPKERHHMSHAAVYAYLMNDTKIANVVAAEILETVQSYDVENDSFWYVNPNWTSADYNLFIQAGSLNKLKNSYSLIKDIQDVISKSEEIQIYNWLAIFANHALSWLDGRFQNYWGEEWWLNGFSKFNNEGLFPNVNGGDRYPLRDENGNPVEIKVSWAQSGINNRSLDVVAFLHSWAVTNNNYEAELKTREFFKSAMKYNLDYKGFWVELYRNKSDYGNDIGIWYTNIALTALVSMAHIDALYNHFPGDKLYDYETTEGIYEGSTNLTSNPYAGSSTTNGITKKGLKFMILAQSRWFRSSVNGGVNDLYYYNGSIINPTDFTMSSEAALANVYYKNPDIEAYYKYNSAYGYVVKKVFKGGYGLSSDYGGWGGLIAGGLWYDMEDYYFDNKNYRSINKAKSMMPAAGLTGQALVKLSNNTNDFEWRYIDGRSINLFNKETITLNQSINSSSGNSKPQGNYVLSDFIPIDAYRFYKASSPLLAYSFYDESKNFISGGKAISLIESPENSKYVRLSFWHSYLDSFQFELGRKTTDYTKYRFSYEERIKKLEQTVEELNGN